MTDIMNEQIAKFIEENEGQWSIPESEQIVLVEGRNLPKQLISSALLANVISEKRGYSPVIVSQEISDTAKAVYGSFGINSFCEIKTKQILRSNPKIALQAFREFIRLAVLFSLKRFNFDWFISSASMHGVKIGDLIYDSYIRHNQHYLNPWKRLDRFMRLMLRTALLTTALKDLYDCQNIRATVVSTTVYASVPALLTRISLQRNIPVSVLTGTFARHLRNESEAYKKVYHVEPEFLEQARRVSNWPQKVEQYLEARFSGAVQEHDVINAYKNKRQWTRTELLAQFKLSVDDRRPIAFVMLHAFSDANHSSGPLLFRDYYQWYEQTLPHIAGLKNVIWVVRPHPSSYMYHETGIAAETLKPYLSENILLCPEDMSTASTFDIADVFITATGTIGIEAACMGVPVILSGQAVYGGYGFTYEPRNRQEYFVKLAEIPSLTRLSDEQVDKARLVLFWYHLQRRPDSEVLPEIAVMPGQTKAEYEKLWEAIFRELRNNLHLKTFRNDPYYQKMIDFVVGSNRVISP